MGIPLHPLEITEDDWKKLPSAKDISNEDLKFVDFGYQFRSKDDALVIGEVCKGEDMFCDQWGAGLSVPPRGVRWFKAVVIKGKYDKRQPVPAANFVGTLAANVDNEMMSDADFRQIVRNTLPIVEYDKADE